MLNFRAIILIVLLVAALAIMSLARQTQEKRPTEKVSPTPQVNYEAAVWRTYDPPENPQAGDVWINPRDDMPLVYVPAGKVVLGTGSAEVEVWIKRYPADQPEWFADQRPRCQIELDGFWIGRTEVTNAQYRHFIQATGHQAPDYWQAAAYPPGRGQYPVVRVSWDDARAYCEWAGGRLPREIEWEHASRGTDGRFFPWGSYWDKTRCNNFSLVSGVDIAGDADMTRALLAWAQSGGTQQDPLKPAGSFASGASPFGVFNLAGNVSEWCAEWYSPTVYARYTTGDLTPPAAGTKRVLRGQSFMGGAPMLFRSAARNAAAPDSAADNIGFRCAR